MIFSIEVLWSRRRAIDFFHRRGKVGGEVTQLGGLLGIVLVFEWLRF